MQNSAVLPYVVLDWFEIGSLEYLCFCNLEEIILIQIRKEMRRTRFVAELLHSARAVDIYCVSNDTIERVNRAFDLSLTECDKSAEARCELSALMKVMKQEHPLLASPAEEMNLDIEAQSVTFDAFCRFVMPSAMMFFIRRFYYSPQCFSVEKLHHFDETPKEFKPGDFVILRRLGSGGRGNVDLCFHKTYGDLFALKSYVGDRKVSGHNFRTEYTSLTRFSHPCILKVFGYVRRSVLAHTDVGICTEFLPNGCLRSVLDLEKQGKTHVGWNYLAKLKTLYGVLLALSELHNRGYMHRDLKTSNVLLNSDFEPCLSDLDSCKEYGSHDNTECTGTFAYEAPEQINGKDYTFYSDLYAFGIFIYEVVTGNFLFPENASYEEVRDRILKGDFPEMPKGTSKVLCQAYSELLHIDPNQRINVKLIESLFHADPYFKTPQMEAYIRKIRLQEKSIDDRRLDLQTIRQEALEGSDSALCQLTLLVITNPSLARYSIGDPYDMLKLCSNLGNSELKRLYGEYLATGQGMAKDEGEGVKITLEVAQSSPNSDDACIFLGKYLLNNRLSGHLAMCEAVKLLKKAAFANSSCYHDLYTCYLRGIGVPVDVEKAIKCLEKGVSCGSRKCCRTMSEVYLSGTLLPRDIEKSLYHASIGFSRAKSAKRHVVLGKIYDRAKNIIPKAEALAKEHFMKAGQLGSLEGKARLLDLRIREGENVSECVNELQVLAETGDPFCCFQCASSLSALDQDLASWDVITKYYRRATKGNIPEAYFQLGKHLSKRLNNGINVSSVRECFAWKSYIGMPDTVYYYTLLIPDIQTRIFIALQGVAYGDYRCYEILYQAMLALGDKRTASIFLKLGCSYGVSYCLTERATLYISKYSLSYAKARPLLEYASDDNSIARMLLGAVYFATAKTAEDIRKAELYTRSLYSIHPSALPRISRESLIYYRVAVLAEMFDDLSDRAEFFELARLELQIANPERQLDKIATLVGRVLFEGGHGVAKDISAGLQILMREADSGNPIASTYIWNLPTPDWTDDVWEAMRRRADSGSFAAQSFIIHKGLDTLHIQLPSARPSLFEGRTFEPAAVDVFKYASLMELSHISTTGEVYQVLYKCYECGIGTPIDNWKALWFCEMAIDYGVVDALYDFARFHEKGIGVIQSFSRSRAIFEQILQMNIKGYVPKAMWKLAKMYSSGIGGPVIADKAYQYAEVLAKIGQPKAAHLAGMLILCKRTCRNLTVGFEFMRHAAEAGIPHAMTYTGAMLLNGFGVKRDTLKGLRWLERACAHGDPDACLLMAQMKYRSSCNWNEVGSLIKAACNFGSSSAQFFYAIMLWHGLGVAQNVGESLELIRMIVPKHFDLSDIIQYLTSSAEFPIKKFALPGLSHV